MNKSMIKVIVFKGILIIFPLLITVHLISVFSSSKLGADANYYLMIGKEILRGGTPMVDIACSYPPLVFYIFAGFLKIFGTSVLVLKFFVLIIHCINACLLGYILYKLNKNLPLIIILASVYFLYTSFIEGYFIVLEPFQILFCLFALIIYFKNRNWPLQFFVLGLFLGLSFLVKQYSLTFIAAFVSILILDFIYRKKTFKEILTQMVLMGGGVIIPFFCFIIFTEATLLQTLKGFGFIGGNIENYIDRNHNSPIKRLYNIFIVLKIYSLILAPFLLYPFFRKLKQSLFDIFFLLGFLTIPILYVRGYAHYLQLIAPWSFCLLYYIICQSIAHLKDVKNNIYAKKVTMIVKYSVFCIIVFHTVSTTLNLLRRNYDKYYLNNPREKQITVNRKVNEVFPKQSNVYVVGSGNLYFECQFYNPLKNYNFNHYKQMLINKDNFQFSKIDTIIIGNKIRNMDERLTIRKILFGKGYYQTNQSLFSESFPFDFFIKK